MVYNFFFFTFWSMSLREKEERERIAENNERKKEIVNEKSVIEIFFGLHIA